MYAHTHTCTYSIKNKNKIKNKIFVDNTGIVKIIQ